MVKNTVPGRIRTAEAIVYANDNEYFIDGYIPKEFRLQETPNVGVCLKEIKIKETGMV